MKEKKEITAEKCEILVEECEIPKEEYETPVVEAIPIKDEDTDFGSGICQCNLGE